MSEHTKEIKLKASWVKCKTDDKERDEVRFIVPYPSTDDFDSSAKVAWERNVDEEWVENRLGLIKSMSHLVEDGRWQ